MSEYIQEYTTSHGASLGVSRTGVIRGVKVLGLESRNGRSYPVATLRAAIGLYEGSKVNVNHPEGNPSGPRDYRDRLGSLRNVRVESGGLFGDLHFNPKHALAEQLLWDAEHAPENVGLSHNVEAKTSRRGGKSVVEEIVRVQSVDLVADPATTSGLFEGSDSLAVKRALVESVADEISMPRWCIPPLQTGLSYRHSREEIRDYLLRLLEVYRDNGVLPKPEPEITTEQFSRNLVGRPVQNPSKTKSEKQHDREVEEFARAVSGRPVRNPAVEVTSDDNLETFARKLKGN